MKQFVNLSTIMMLACVLLFACNDNEEKDWGTFSVESPTGISVSKNGSEASVTVTGTAIYVPMSSEPWCTIVGKTETGFDFRIEPNTLAKQRTANVVVSAVGFPFFVIEITQDAGDPIMTIDQGQRSKSFDKTGGGQTVIANINLDYIVTSPEAWCTITDITATGFRIVTEALEEPGQRTANLLVEASGFSPITIAVTQIGEVVIQNMISGGDMETASAWTILYSASASVTARPSFAFGHTDDSPANGDGGCLKVAASNPGGLSELTAHQKVILEAGVTYKIDAAYKWTDMINIDFRMYVSPVAPVDGADYRYNHGVGNPAAIAEIGRWTGSPVGNFAILDNTLSGYSAGTKVFTPETTGDYYVVIFVATGATDTYNFYIDNLSLIAN